MSLQRICYNLNDLHRYIRQYEIPLEPETTLSKIGSIIRQYLYKKIEFKVNCKVGMNDRLISCCASLLPLNTSVSSRKKKQQTIDPSTDFYIAFNIYRSQSIQSTTEPNAILFKYPNYTNIKETNKEFCRGIQLDFLAQKQLQFLVIATPIKPIKYKNKKRRGSFERIKYPIKTKLITSQSKPLNKKRLKPLSANYRNQKLIQNIPNSINNNIAIIYPQNNLLWSIYKNKPKIIEHNAWLPIISLWKQNQTNILYMLRGENKKKIKKKQKKRYKRGRKHIRTYTQSEPMPNQLLTQQKIIIHKNKNRKKNSKNECVRKKLKPCKFYKIVIGEKEVICENIFDFPYLNISHELIWFDCNTQSLLVIINNNKNKYIKLQIIKHKNIGLKIPQSTTKNYNKNKGLNLSSSQLYHMKLENETVKLSLKLPKKYLYLFENCQCLKLFYHKQSNSYILLLAKYNMNNKLQNKMLLKLKINFLTTKIEHISYGIVNKNNNNYNIIGYDYNRSLLIMDTFYEPINPLSTNIFANNRKILKSQPSNIYYQYNKWFSFACAQFIKRKYQIITKKFIVLSINDFIYQWENIYDCKINKHLKIINYSVMNKSL